MINRLATGCGLSRRGALLSLLGGATALPFRAGAQVTPPVTIPPQITPPALQPPLQPQAVTAPVLTGIDKSKIYYVFFDQQIDINSMRTLRRQLAALVEAGVTQIVLVINSGGGQIAATLLTYSFIRSLPVRIDTHAQGFVASAAVLLFLAGDDRSADQTARFIFHPTQTMIPGLLNEQQIHEQLTEVDTVAAMMTQIYHDRTSLTDQQLQQFSRGELIYTAEQAKQGGVIQTIADLKLPAGQTAKILFLD